MSNIVEPTRLTKKDFETDQDVRWCPGCGDYSILANVQKVMPELGIPLEQMVWVSGIGCSSRFPYYMNTYGFHTIHGRGPAFATGIKIANPKLSVWLATGDGDGLSIGGNHLMHCLRRNVDDPQSPQKHSQPKDPSLRHGAPPFKSRYFIRLYNRRRGRVNRGP